MIEIMNTMSNSFTLQNYLTKRKKTAKKVSSSEFDILNILCSSCTIQRSRNSGNPPVVIIPNTEVVENMLVSNIGTVKAILSDYNKGREVNLVVGRLL